MDFLVNVFIERAENELRLAKSIFNLSDNESLDMFDLWVVDFGGDLKRIPKENFAKLPKFSKRSLKEAKHQEFSEFLGTPKMSNPTRNILMSRCFRGCEFRRTNYSNFSKEVLQKKIRLDKIRNELKGGTL